MRGGGAECELQVEDFSKEHFQVGGRALRARAAPSPPLAARERLPDSRGSCVLRRLQLPTGCPLPPLPTSVSPQVLNAIKDCGLYPRLLTPEVVQAMPRLGSGTEPASKTGDVRAAWEALLPAQGCLLQPLACSPAGLLACAA